MQPSLTVKICLSSNNVEHFYGLMVRALAMYAKGCGFEFCLGPIFSDYVNQSLRLRSLMNGSSMPLFPRKGAWSADSVINFSKLSIFCLFIIANNIRYRRITNLCVKNILRIVHYKVVCVYIYAV